VSFGDYLLGVIGLAAVAMSSPCFSLPPSGLGGPLSSGDITVVDAPPLPTAKAQCKNGGWKQFGFKNQGRCIAFVKPRA
jgi:hypothetical protein